MIEEEKEPSETEPKVAIWTFITFYVCQQFSSVISNDFNQQEEEGVDDEDED